MKDNKIYDVLVVGGGASGLMTCANLDEKLKTAVVECGDKVGKKILASGNGKCNLTNLFLDVSAYNNPFVSGALKRFGTREIVQNFAQMGLKVKADEQGRVYPYGETASSVSDVLRRRLEQRGVETITGVKVEKITHKGLFEVCSADRTFVAKRLVFACGTNASFGFDSNGLLKNFGHKEKPLSPSLCPIKCDTTYLKGLGGVRAKCRVTLYKSDEAVCVENGEVLFKDFGLSGIAIFNLSAHIARVSGEYEVGINFFPDLDVEGVAECFVDRLENLGLKTADEFFVGVFHKNVAKNILAYSGISEVTAKNVASLVRAATDMRVKVISLCDFSLAQVASGGLKTSDFDENTMQSKLVKGLYAVGEALDVDGVCGGFNLHWAWSSALCAAADINKSFE